MRECASDRVRQILTRTLETKGFQVSVLVFELLLIIQSPLCVATVRLSASKDVFSLRHGSICYRGRGNQCIFAKMFCSNSVRFVSGSSRVSLSRRAVSGLNDGRRKGSLSASSHRSYNTSRHVSRVVGDTPSRMMTPENKCGCCWRFEAKIQEICLYSGRTFYSNELLV